MSASVQCTCADECFSGANEFFSGPIILARQQKTHKIIFASFYKRLGIKSLKCNVFSDRLARLISQVDDNKDGNIDEDEYAALFNQNITNEDSQDDSDAPVGPQ